MKIEVDDLSLSISSKKILEDVSINLNNKEFVGLVGPNGSGKSTLLKAIYRILKPSSGSIFINGKDISKLSIKSTSREMAVVSQFNEQNFEFKVIDMVLLGRTPHKKAFEMDNKEDFRISMDALKKVSMEDYYNREFSTLSGGEKQRVLLARSLAQNVDILILDEPTNHLDIKHQLQILELVKSLNITVLAALHDLNLASNYCDRIYVLNNGNIVSSGYPEEVLTERMIKDVFGVNSEVSLHPKTNKLNVVYLSNSI